MDDMSSRRPRHHHTRGGSSSQQGGSGSHHDDSEHSGEHMISPFAGQDPTLAATDVSGAGSSTGALVSVYTTAKGQLEFSSGHTSSALRDCMLARVNNFWLTFSDIPGDVKGLMFTDFLKKFAWAEDVHEHEVLKVWRKKASIKYREWAYEMRSKEKRHGSCPEEVYARFLAYWDTPEFKASSEKASASRKANPKLHTGGSRSYADYRNDMIGGGKEPTDWEVYCRTYKVESTGAEDESTNSGWIDHASQQFATDFDVEVKRLESDGQDITPDVQETIFRSLTDKQTRRRDRRPNVGNIPTKNKSRNRASTSSVNQGNEDEESLQTRFDNLEKRFNVLQNYVHQNLPEDQMPPPES